MGDPDKNVYTSKSYTFFTCNSYFIYQDGWNNIKSLEKCINKNLISQKFTFILCNRLLKIMYKREII